MKKIFLTLVVVSSLFSCSKDEVNEPKSVESVKVNSQRVSEEVFGKVYYNQEGDLKLRIMRSVRDPKKISLVSAEDSKDYFLLRDAEALFVPASSKFDAYFLSKADKFMNTAERTPFIKKFNNILVLAASNGTAARLDIAKDLSYVELKGETDAIKFTKL